MHDRVGGTACPWLTLEEIVARDSASLKRSIAQARLVVVHNREIDNAGEAGVGPAVFDDVMQKLRAAWHQRPWLPAARRWFHRPAAARAPHRSEAPARVLAIGG
jgi:hypothetical protein